MPIKRLLALLFVIVSFQPVFGLKDSLIVAKAFRKSPALPSRYEASSKFGMRFMDVEQGLPSSYIMGMSEDPFGRIWCATDGSGIFCFDGKEIRSLSEEESLPANSSTMIFADSKGRVWYGGSGIPFCVIENNKTIRIITLDSSSTEKIYFVKEIDHQLFIGAAGGLYKEENGEVKKVTTDLQIETIFDIETDGKGGFFIAANSGIHHATSDFKSLNQFTISVKKMARDGAGQIIAINDSLCVKIDIQGSVNTLFTRPPASESFNDLVLGNGGQIWISTWGSGIYILDGNQHYHYHSENGLRSDRVWQLYKDSFGKIWICTDGGGLQFLSAPQFLHYSAYDGISTPYIMEVKKINGELWLGTRGGGLYILNTEKNEIRRETFNDKLKAELIFALHKDKSGAIWIGAFRDGLYRYANGNLQHFSEKDGFTAKTVWSIDEGPDGKIVIATFSGLYLFSNDKFEHFTEAEGLLSDKIYSVGVAPDGKIYCGTLAGLSVLENHQFKNYTRKEGLPQDIIWDIAFDQGKVYLASYGGFTEFNGSTFKTWSAQDGLVTSVVWAIEKSGDSWYLGTEKGFQKVRIEKNQLSIENTYGFNSGFIGNDVAPAAICVEGDDQVWLGTSKGLTRFSPAKIQAQIKLPAPKINGIQLFYQNYDWENQKTIKTDGIDLEFLVPQNPIFTFNERIITIQYRSFFPSEQENVQYQFSLEKNGIEEEFHTTSDDQQTYTNLEAGDYVFKVQASIDGKTWSDITKFSFSILPPYYMTWWFRITVILIVAFIIWFFIWNRTRTLRENQRKLELQVKERTSELSVKNAMLAEKNKEILDSMTYAKRIQGALFASEELLKEKLDDYFIYYQPREVVSGDFYWAGVNQNGAEQEMLFCVADCTGHGVPGAFMSLLNIAFINEAVREKKISDPAKIFDFVRAEIIHALNADGRFETRDGMDAVMISLSESRKTIKVAMANNPVWIMRSGELLEFVPDKMPVGMHYGEVTGFQSTEINVQSGDIIYLFTDGYADQFGGENLPSGKAGGKKFKYSRMKELIKSIQHLSLSEQQHKFKTTIENWRGDLEQIDDILVCAFKIK